jgi:Tol biopolymer transport system component
VPGLSTLREPAWSPDGRWLAATGSAATGRHEDWDVVLLPIGGGVAYRVTSGVAHDHAPSWLTP